MSDIIHLLSDAVANQIAAGEVIQRPSSAVKELIENAVDAGASSIQLIIKDAGRTLIQVVDNGNGMSFTDARMCFERHATSKLASADDLFRITTKGFRGEALASIAAIAQVELKTKKPEENTGTQLLIEGSEVKEHSPIATQDGTSIAIKNLFFNVPARRNFLKSDHIEFGHIEEEFYRVALIHHTIAFTLFHNGKMVLQLQPSNFKQRIINIFGNHFKDKLFPVEQHTDFMQISGFIAKPENAKKKKSEQYMFINHRYVRHHLLNYAVETAYSELIPQGYKPAYFINIDVNPATIDINISPTKVEIKLQDERLIFGFLNSTIKKSLGTMSLTPRLDFDYEPGLDVSNFPEKKEIIPPSLNINPHYNPFHTTASNTPKSKSEYTGSFEKGRVNLAGWDDFLKGIKTETIDLPSGINEENTLDFKNCTENLPKEEFEDLNFMILDNYYLILNLQNQLNILHIPHARERILYENYLNALQNKPITVQQSLFPETITLTSGMSELAIELKDELFKLGYDIEQIDTNHFAVNGTPNEEEGDIQTILENVLEAFKSNLFLYKTEKEQNMALSLARQKRSLYKPLKEKVEITQLLQQLFACQVTCTSPSGKTIIRCLSKEELDNLFI
ncbi:MAG: DNA mismatch repair endonuclease MutL [Bacteroidales bacterium]